MHGCKRLFLLWNSACVMLYDVHWAGKANVWKFLWMELTAASVKKPFWTTGYTNCSTWHPVVTSVLMKAIWQCKKLTSRRPYPPVPLLDVLCQSASPREAEFLRAGVVFLPPAAAQLDRWGLTNECVYEELILSKSETGFPPSSPRMRKTLLNLKGKQQNHTNF